MILGESPPMRRAMDCFEAMSRAAGRSSLLVAMMPVVVGVMSENGVILAGLDLSLRKGVRNVSCCHWRVVVLRRCQG